MGNIASSKHIVTLKTTGMSALKIDKILAAVEATVDRNINCHCWYNFGSSENYSRQECQLPLLQEFGGFKKYVCQLRRLRRSIGLR